MFFAILGMCETNAYLAMKQVMTNQGLPKMSHKEFRLRLGMILMADPLAIGVGRMVR